MQRPAPVAARDLGVGAPRILERPLRRHPGEGAEPRLKRLDPFELAGRDLDRRQVAVTDALRQLDQR